MIRKLSEREHIRQRPSMYIGAVNPTTTNEYILDDSNKKIIYKEVSVVPGLIKIINEIIDNSVDVAIKTNFKSSNEISVKISDYEVEVTDNGTGIPVKKNEDGQYLPELCWNHARAGSNFDDDDNRTQIGMNGVGSFATNCFSTKFVGITDDGANKYEIISTNGAEKFKENVKKSSGKTGTTVKFSPDLTMFNIDKIDDTHKMIIKQRLLNLSMSFPEITFKFNSKKISTNSFKKYISLFSEHSYIYENDNFKFAVLPNEEDDFRQFSYVNGLKIPDGGTHIDIISNNIVNGIREKLIKKYKSIKPGDIKNKLMVVAFIKNFPNPKFNSQSKEKITNSTKEVNEFYGDIEWDKAVNKIIKTSEIISNITEMYRLKEELQKRKELKGLDKVKKKIKSEKYTRAVGSNNILIICEGASAKGGLMPIIGRDGIAYYELKGKPLNAYTAPQSKFTSNKELSELYKIIKNEGFNYIVTGTDQDLDGISITSLVLGFAKRYLPEELSSGKIGRLQTPIFFTRGKNKKPKEWFYNLRNIPSEDGEYMKGLGSWEQEDLEYIIKKDGIEKMITIFEDTSDETIEEWLGDDSSPRKKYIIENDFDLIKL